MEEGRINEIEGNPFDSEHVLTDGWKWKLLMDNRMLLLLLCLFQLAIQAANPSGTPEGWENVAKSLGGERTAEECKKVWMGRNEGLTLRLISILSIFNYAHYIHLILVCFG